MIEIIEILLVRMDSMNRYSVYEIIPTNIKEYKRWCLYFYLYIKNRELSMSLTFITQVSKHLWRSFV